LAAANKYLGQLVVKEHGFSIAAYERRPIGFRVDVVKASAQYSRLDKDTPLSGKAEAAL